jgi:hypothetical protein
VTTLQRNLIIAAGVVIATLTGIAFALSYAHLHTVAASNGVPDDWRAWTWPATLDAFIVAGELLMFVAALRRERDWWAVGITVAGSVGSIALNVAGVGGDATALQYVAAGVPPTAALLSFAVLIRQVHRLVQRAEDRAATHATAGQTTDAAPAVAADGATATPDVAPVAEEPGDLAAAFGALAPRNVDDAQPLHVVRADVAPAPVVSARVADDVAPSLLSVADVAEEMGVSPATVRSWVHRGRIEPVSREGGLRFDQAAVKALA